MCGIAGILAFQHGPVAAQEICKMTATIRHRGPDDEGTYLNGCIGLGHQRLAILDLSPAGHQPMAGPDGTTWIVYNGEIYNSRELRDDLLQQGHQFTTQTDTEVILHAYQAYGVNCLAQFNGMFAFAIWDSRRQQLFLARDRLGIKPLYYCRSGHRLYFASEIKALLAVLDRTPQSNRRLLYDFLTTGILDHTDETFFTGIHKLPAAHYMVIDVSGQVRLQRYWDFAVNDEIALLSDQAIEEQAQTFFALFRDAVRLHLVSDVPVGSCLSGGLDSSAVVTVISRLIGQSDASAVGPRQQTFSACYPGTAVDEQPYIDTVTQVTGAVSHRVFPQAEDFLRDLPDVLWHQEEPFAATSIYAQWAVMRAARDQGVKVLLDGQGADEQLLGYRKFYAFYVQQLLKRGKLRLGVTELFKHFGSWSVLKTLQLRRGLRYLGGGLLGSPVVAGQLVQTSFKAEFKAAPLRIGVENSLAERIKTDMTCLSLPALLRYEDKNSMAFAREARVPFLDYRLVEFVAGLPLNLKLHQGWTKYCLRRGAQDLLPAKILRRKDKLGFATPEDHWLRQELRDEVRRTLMGATFLPQFITMPQLLRHFDAFVARQRPLLSSEFFLRFFIVEKWAHRFLMS